MNLIVSVIVITYNSSRFILETLESINAQTYHDIELIISDDASGDNTIELCQNWLSKNEKRFVRSQIITVSINRGISANCNRGLSAANGEWIKYIAGDDALLPNCIKDNVIWITSHPQIRVLFSRIEIYKDTFESQNHIAASPGDPYNPKSIIAPEKSANSQYKMLLLCDRINFTPSVFLNREVLLSVKGFNERFRFLEDYPLWLSLTKIGHKLYFMDTSTVNYRQHLKAINNTGADNLINPNFFKSEAFRKVYTYPYLPFDIKLNQRYCWFASQIFRCNWLNKDQIINRFLMNLFLIYMNPFRYYIYLKKHLIKDLDSNEFYL